MWAELLRMSLKCHSVTQNVTQNVTQSLRMSLSYSATDIRTFRLLPQPALLAVRAAALSVVLFECEHPSVLVLVASSMGSAILTLYAV